MAISLQEACVLNGTSEITSFIDLQNNCNNPDYFYDKPINKLSSWEGFYAASFTLPIDFYVQATSGITGALDCSFKCSGSAVLGSQSTQSFNFDSGLISNYYITDGSLTETRFENMSSLYVTTDSTTFNDYAITWGFALHDSSNHDGGSTDAVISYNLYWQVEKEDGTIFDLLSTSNPVSSTSGVSVSNLTINQEQSQSASPQEIVDGDRIRILIII